MAYKLVPAISTIMTARQREHRTWAGIVVAHPHEVRHRHCSASYVYGHHKERQEEHRRDGADPVKMQSQGAVFRACRHDPDNLESSAICCQEGECCHGRGQRSTGVEKHQGRVGLPPDDIPNGDYRSQVRRNRQKLKRIRRGWGHRLRGYYIRTLIVLRLASFKRQIRRENRKKL